MRFAGTLDLDHFEKRLPFLPLAGIVSIKFGPVVELVTHSVIGYNVPIAIHNPGGATSPSP